MGDFAAAEADATTLTDAQKEARAKHTQSLRAMAESLSVARETAHTLSMQSEQLDRSERVVDETQQVADLSKRILRGMTWSGWLYNAVSSAPQPAAKRDASQSTEIAMGFICPECRVKFASPEHLAAHYAKTHEAALAAAVADSDSADADADALSAARTATGGRRSRPDSASRSSGSAPVPATATTTAASATTKHHPTDRGDVHDAFLRALEPQLAELKEVSLALGHALDTQNRQLERLDDKVETVHDSLKRVSMQAKRLTGGSSALGVTFRFRCALQDVASGKFVRDVEGDTVLGADVVVDGCTFRAYTLGDGTEVWGFQSETSSLFLGVNRFGTLKVQGQAFRSYEQFAIDHTRATTALFCIASFFGFGGWVTTRANDPTLGIIRGSRDDKAKAARFKLVHLDVDDAVGDGSVDDQLDPQRAASRRR